MGHLLGAIDQARLDEQRGVVKNEKRQGENQPYGRVFASVVSASFPADHPYHWLPIGSMEDLDAASLDDVKEWFRTYYGAANAVLVLAGDIDVATARTQAQKYFGAHTAGPRYHATGDLGRSAHGIHARDDVRPGGADAPAPVLEHPGGRHHGSRSAGPGGRDPGQRKDIEALRASRVPRPDRGQRLRRPERARDRGAVRYHGRREVRRRRTEGRSGDRGGAAPLHDKGPDEGRARSRPDGGALQFHQGPRADRRLRRQGRRAGILRGVRSGSGLLSTIAARGRGGDARAAAAGRRALARTGRLHARGATVSRVSRLRDRRRRSEPRIARDRHVPGPRLPDARAREARKRHTGHPCQPTERAGGAGRRALQCRLRGGS